MALTEIQQRILKTVVERFVNLKESTERIALVRKFEDPDAIDELHQWRLLKTADGSNYLPTALSFHYCGNEEIEAYAKRGMEVLAEIFRSMYLRGKVDFTPEGLISEAAKIDGHADERMIRLGLYVAPEFGLLAGFAGGNPQQPDITPTGISERVVKLKNIDMLWDTFINESIPSPVRDSSGGTLPDHSSIEGYDDEESLMRYEGFSSNQEILVFISHSSKDSELALALIELLKAGLGLLSNQIRCSSVDGYRLPVGVNTESKLREEVSEARVVIGLITPSSLASAFVMFELGARWGANNFLAPLLAGVRPSELSGPLSLLNALLSDNEAQLHQLLKDVSIRLGKPLQDTASYVRNVHSVKELAEATSGFVTSQPRKDVLPEAKLRIFPGENSVYMLKPYVSARRGKFVGGYFRFDLRIENRGDRNAAIVKYELHIIELDRAFTDLKPEEGNHGVGSRHSVQTLLPGDSLSESGVVRIPADDTTDQGVLAFYIQDLSLEGFASKGLLPQGEEKRFPPLHCRLTLTDMNRASTSAEFSLQEE
jgi:TIR domain